jgi:hypothetical protein
MAGVANLLGRRFEGVAIATVALQNVVRRSSDTEERLSSVSLNPLPRITCM